MSKTLKILVKLPVKLGDTVMAAYFLRSVKNQFPDSRLDVILAKGLTELLDFMPYVDGYHEFSKKEFSGPTGNYRFGKKIQSKEKYDLLFCLPFSFSSALASFFSGAKIRIGYASEHRNFLFSKAIKRPEGLHIVDEFNYLLESYSGEKTDFSPLNFHTEIVPSVKFSKKKKIVLNIKSGPPSRSIPVTKAVSIIEDVLKKYDFEVILTGAPNEVDYISQVKNAFTDRDEVINLAGKTSLTELFGVIGKAECMITSDSGNAHIANAVGTPSVVLFGAAHPHRARPYDQSIAKVLRLENLECVPCQSEHCKYGDNRCLAGIPNEDILLAMGTLLNMQNSAKQNLKSE